MVLSPTARMRGYASALLLLSLLVAACDAGATTVARPTATSAPPTATPVFAAKLPVHQITLGDFQAQGVTPNAHGLMLFGRPASLAHVDSPTPQPAVYFYDFASQTMQTLATPTPAPDGTARGITSGVAAGDWIVYSVGDFGGGSWEIWAVNVVTRELLKLDTFLDEGSVAAEGWRGLVATDGQNAVWSANIATTSRPTWVLRSYTFASGSAHTLLSGPGTPTIGPLAMANGTLLFKEAHPSPSPQDGIYLWTLGEPSAKQISTDPTANGHLNDRYVVWDEPQSRSLTLYDRTTGKLTEQWEPGCIRPDVAQDRPYVACDNFDNNLMQLTQIPTGQAVTLGDATQGSAGAIGNDRAYWMAPGNGPGGAGNIVDYVDLPAA